MPRMTIKSLLEKIAGFNAELHLRAEQIAQYERTLGNQEETKRTQRNEISILKSRLEELKDKLFHSETENARLSGYLRRVNEDDTVREELVHVQPHDDIRSPVSRDLTPVPVPKRSIHQIGHAPAYVINEGYHHIKGARRYGPGEQAPPKSWINWP